MPSRALRPPPTGLEENDSNKNMVHGAGYRKRPRASGPDCWQTNSLVKNPIVCSPHPTLTREITHVKIIQLPLLHVGRWALRARPGSQNPRPPGSRTRPCPHPEVPMGAEGTPGFARCFLGEGLGFFWNPGAGAGLLRHPPPDCAALSGPAQLGSC